jgi:hypothetical protein
MSSQQGLGLRVRPKLWTPEDLSHYLGVQVGWVYKHCRKNCLDRVPHIKLGKYLRFDPESQTFQGWLAQHESNSAQTRNSFDER